MRTFPSDSKDDGRDGLRHADGSSRASGPRRDKRTARAKAKIDQERNLARFLRQNHSVISRQQLRELNYSSSGIGRLVEREVLVPAGRGAYRSGSVHPTPFITLKCNLVSAGPRAALSGEAAAFHMGLIQFSPRRPRIVVPRRTSKRKRNGFDLVCDPGLGDDDVWLVHDLWCTTPFRTMLDLAAATRRAADYRLLRRALREACRRDRKLAARLHAEIDARRPFRGCRVLETLLDEHLETTLVIRSDLETAFLELCIANDIPLPATNVVLHGVELDCYWHEYNAYVELDTFRFHGDHRSFESDRGRDGDLVEHDLRGLRVTDRRIDREPDKVVRQTKALLGLAAGARRKGAT